jgi:hypothetical protein
MIDPFRVMRGKVAVIKRVQKRADQPADFFAEFLVAIAISLIPKDACLPAGKPVGGGVGIGEADASSPAAASGLLESKAIPAAAKPACLRKARRFMGCILEP